MIAPYKSTESDLAQTDDARASIIELYYDRVYGLVWSRCRDHHMAEDATQATFYRLFERSHCYVEQGRFESWLFRLALNQLCDEQRRRRRWVRSNVCGATNIDTCDESRPDANAQRAEILERLIEAVARLSAVEQDLLHLRFAVGLSSAAIAERRSTPLGTVLARGHRAIKKLRATLD